MSSPTSQRSASEVSIKSDKSVSRKSDKSDKSVSGMSDNKSDKIVSAKSEKSDKSVGAKSNKNDKSLSAKSTKSDKNASKKTEVDDKKEVESGKKSDKLESSTPPSPVFSESDDESFDETNAVEVVSNQVHNIYENKDDGLMRIGRALGIEIERPRRKVAVMIIGNHSAGKSSFINWYIGDAVQHESVAMETSAFTFVSHGKKRETFKGRATIKHKPFLNGVEVFPGAVENLCTQISPSRRNLFGMVDFVDTPGLTDGSLKYPYPVNDILEWLGDKVDLIFVCFDPHGQALCERTMNVVQELNASQKSKIHYFLTMADKISSEKERSKVILQMAQSLSHAHTRSSEGKETWLGEHALRVRPIFLPTKAHISKQQDVDFNRIDEVLELIRDSVNQHVQNHVERLEVDSKRLLETAQRDIASFDLRSRINRILALIRTVLLLTAWAIPSVLVFYLIHFLEAVFLPKEWLEAPHLQPIFDLIHAVSMLARYVDTSEDRYRILGCLCISFLLFLFLAKVLGKCFVTVKSKAEAEQMHTWKGRLTHIHDVEVPALWKLYFSDSTYDNE